MKMILCSVFDRQSRQYSAPFSTFTAETAIRDFARAVRDSKGAVDKFPQDYELFCIGSWDPDLGTVDSSGPEFLASGASYCEES